MTGLRLSWRKLCYPPDYFGIALFLLVVGLFFGAKAISSGHVFAILTFLLVLLNLRKWPCEWRRLRWSSWCLLAFLFLCALSVFVNWEIADYQGALLKKLRYPAIFLFFLLFPSLHHRILEEIKKRDWLMLGWVLPMIIAIFVGGVGMFTGKHPLRGTEVVDMDRLSGVYGQVMTFANTLQFSVIALVMLTTSYFLCKNLSRTPWWLLVLALFLGAAGLYLSYTRGAMLACAAGMIIYAAMHSRSFLFWMVVIGLAATGIAFKEGARYSDSESSLRVSQWKTASLAFLDRPIRGYGYGNFELQCIELKKKFGIEKDLQPGQRGATELTYFQSHAHNNYLEAFVATGIFGGVAFLGFCFFWMREAMKSRYALYFVPLIVAFLISGFFENTFFDGEVLNAILLIYLFSQMVFNLEEQIGFDHSEASGAGSGLTTTET